MKDLGDLMLGQLVQNCGDDVSGCRLDSGYVPIQDQGKGRACMRGGFDVRLGGAPIKAYGSN